MLGLTANSFSQDYDSIFNKAKYYYENNEYQVAIPWFSKCIEKNPLESKAYKYRGNCYMESGFQNKAIQDYLTALKIKKSSDILYNLGNAYEKAENVDSAIFYFHRFIEMEPKVADGYIRLSVQFMYSYPELGDSAIYYAEKAVKVEPDKAANLNYLAIAYYAKAKYKNALETALAGLRIDSSFSALYQTAGISSFFLADYSSAISYFEKAFSKNPSDFTSLDFKIQSILLKNTDSKKIHYKEGTRISFNEISSETFKKAEDAIVAKNSNYNYSKLTEKIKSTPLSMSLDEFLMLYIGYSMQNDYDPNKKPSSEKIVEDDLFNELEILDKFISVNPTDFPKYLELADIYLELGNMNKYFENRYKYYGFAESIKASGDGLTVPTAYIVNDISHENRIMASLGYRIVSQSRVKQKNHYYDLLTGIDRNNKDIAIYFNIDKPFRTLPKKGK
jgi:tetratricopeptide (TPR) repeat protein